MVIDLKEQSDLLHGVDNNGGIHLMELIVISWLIKMNSKITLLLLKTILAVHYLKVLVIQEDLKANRLLTIFYQNI